YYDPMAGKLIVWAEDRNSAIKRMKRALEEFQIEGIKTTIPFCLLVLDHPSFIDGSFTTKFVDNYWAELQSKSAIDPDIAEVIAVAVAHHRDAQKMPQNGVAHAKQLPPASTWKLQMIK
ncbi:MAG: biotin carboxylase, partial [Calditrichaeota bacterium]|nr:biotin carboxylase [Calditrichota bacterium]